MGLFFFSRTVGGFFVWFQVFSFNVEFLTVLSDRIAGAFDWSGLLELLACYISNTFAGVDNWPSSETQI